MPSIPPNLAVDLRDAVAQNSLDVAFQPEFDLHTHEIHAVETLVRWTHPCHGEIAPTDFIRLAEQSDVIVELGRWVIDAALTQFASWMAQLTQQNIVLRINVAVAQLARPEFVDELSAALRRHSTPPQQVCLEITETAPLAGPAGVAETVRQLQTMGVSVAIDDLANGYSTLSSVRFLPVDVVKVDRSLIAGIDTDVRAAIILSSILTMARELDIQVVVEGIENAREAAAVVSLGCTRAQGNYFALPMSGDEFLDLLRARPGESPESSRAHPTPPVTRSTVRPRPRPRPR